MASGSVSKCSSCLRMRLFSHDQHFSIRFKSGEYGGKYATTSLQPELVARGRPPL